MSVCDVAIIGGGIVGCSAALHLSRRGASVVLLERRQCGSQASGVNYGGVRQQGRNPAELPLAVRSRQIWASLRELVGSNCEFDASGHLKLARCERDMTELESHAELARQFGLDLELFDGRRLKERYPWLGDVVVGGSFCRDDGSANPRLVVPAFARAADDLGADIRQGVDVVRACLDRRGFCLSFADGSVLTANRLVNAAGAWATTICKQFGEPVPEGVMAPNMCVTDPIPYFLQPNLGVCRGDIYVRQIPRGNVIFGGGEGTADRVAIRARPLAEVTARVARLAMDLVPRLARAQIIRTWSGIEGVMPDRIPVIGPSRITPGLFHAFGFSGHGFQLGPAVGAVLSELILDGRTPTPIEAFDIGRFSTSCAMQDCSGPAAFATTTPGAVAASEGVQCT